MEKWSGQVIYAALAISAGAGLCGLTKDPPASVTIELNEAGPIHTQGRLTFSGRAEIGSAPTSAPKMILALPDKGRGLAFAR